METIKSVIFDWGGVLIDDPAPGLMQYCADALKVSKEDYIKAHSKFEADFQKCVPIDVSSFHERPWYWHFGVNFSHLLAPIL